MFLIISFIVFLLICFDVLNATMAAEDHLLFSQRVSFYHKLPGFATIKLKIIRICHALPASVGISDLSCSDWHPPEDPASAVWFEAETVLFSIFHIGMMSGHKDRRHRLAPPYFRAAVLRIFQQIIMERIKFC